MSSTNALVSDLIGSTPDAHTRAVTLAVRSAMTRLDLFDRPWSVACSGGPDSLALTFAAADLAARTGVRLTAIIVDHGMREESGEEAFQTANLLSQWGIDSVIEKVRVEGTGGLEAAAREARYRALRENTRPGGAILLGHTMDDQAETVLLGLGRGSGTRSLSGMREYTEDSRAWVRPLLSIRRTDTVGMCAELGLPAIADPSNQINGGWTTSRGEPLPRIAMRHRVIPELSKALGRDVVPLLARSAKLLDRDATALENLANKQTAKQTASHVLIVKELAKLEPAILTRVLIDAAIQAGSGALEAAHVDALERLVTNYNGGGPIHLPNGVRARREKTVVDGTLRAVVKIFKQA
ncbi:MAG: tRNA lysidine(34) synthetase TilS [Actinomycetaceae bacterium]|nr:tRNA lysidine(34) synthetase TilS [Actinomycetaceae bacterium]